MTKQERFEALQQRVQTAEAEARAFRVDLNVRFSSTAFAGNADRKKLERLDARAKRAFDAFFKFVASISPRTWDSGVPCHWIGSKLTFADATTRGQLSTVPPPAWGFTQADMEQFALPVQETR